MVMKKVENKSKIYLYIKYAIKSFVVICGLIFLYVTFIENHVIESPLDLINNHLFSVYYVFLIFQFYYIFIKK